MDARGGALYLEWPEGKAVLDLGDQAERWAEKIKNPPSLLDKLGVKPGPARLRGRASRTAEFLDELSARVDDLTRGRAQGRVRPRARGHERPRRTCRASRSCARRSRPTGAIWVVWPKGRKEFREDDVRAFGPTAGLVDVKVARFSETLSALKMMIPRAQR